MIEYYKNRSIQDIEGEKWLPISGYEDLYSISNFGRLNDECTCVLLKGGGNKTL
jgi:hypothetical protein